MRPYYKSDILKMAREKDSFKPIVVHFLIKEEKIVFVGRDEYEKIDFDKYFSIPCKNEEEALALEARYTKSSKSNPNKKKKNEAVIESLPEPMPEQHKPLTVTPIVFNIPLNSYEKKYSNGRFVWVFNVDGVLYEGEYDDNKSYSLNGKIFKPRQTKGFIEV